MTNKISIILFILLSGISSFGQRPRVLNLPKYDQKPYHFGFSLGVNKYDFTIKPIANFHEINDTLYILESTAQSGFNINIVTNLKLLSNLDLRFIPGLSFGGRTLEYTMIDKGNRKVMHIRPIESTLIEFPLSLKYKSARLNNFRAYLLGGAKYSLDLASQQNKKEEEQDLVRLKKHDLAYELGFGLDIYFQYFKFSPEIKFSMGMRDLLVRENDIYTRSISRLNSKVILISFLFE